MDPARELQSPDLPRIIGLLVAVDYGSKRIGLAITDPQQRLATPAGILAGRRDADADALAVAAWGRDRQAAGYIVGLPLNMDSTAGPQAEFARRFAERLSGVSNLPVRLVDERLTSFQADQWLADAGRPKGSGKGHPARDALAALAILQAYLNQWKGSTGEPTPPADDRSGDGRDE
ncbi:MAG: putative pre-16S rRNA nuclease [Planctomycetota bacterium]